MAVIEDKTRSLYPVDGKGKITVQDLIDTTGGSAPAELAANKVNVSAHSAGGITAGNLQTVLNALSVRVKALEDAGA